ARRSDGELRPPDQPPIVPAFGRRLGRDDGYARRRARQAYCPHSPGVDHAGQDCADDSPQLEPRPRIDPAKLAQVVDGNIAAQLWQLAPRPAHDRDMTGPARPGQRTEQRRRAADGFVEPRVREDVQNQSHANGHRSHGPIRPANRTCQLLAPGVLCKTMTTDPRAPLHSVRVLDASRVLAGPFCGQVLGDLGADVIKLERPGSGDETRGWGPPFAGPLSAYYLSCNRNKRALTLDLAKPAGKQLFDDLVKQCDILLENFRAASADRLGLSPETLLRLNPRLILCSIS